MSKRKISEQELLEEFAKFEEEINAVTAATGDKAPTTADGDKKNTTAKPPIMHPRPISKPPQKPAAPTVISKAPVINYSSFPVPEPSNYVEDTGPSIGGAFAPGMRILGGTGASAVYMADNTAPAKKKGRFVRQAAGQLWEDPTLADWPDDDHRLFVGDLGNDVNDDTLSRAFARFPSFSRARVVRDKRTGKTKGYGFVSFTDAQDCLDALDQMHGKYIGNRPVKLRRSRWEERNMDTTRLATTSNVGVGGATQISGGVLAAAAKSKNKNNALKKKYTFIPNQL